MRPPRSRKTWPPELRLAFWGFFLHLLWEIGHTPLYADSGRNLGYLAWTRVHCTLGDVLILLGAFWLTALVFRDRKWYLQKRLAPTALFVAAGLGYTVWSEWFNTSLRSAWTYRPEMPTVFGVGLTPLLQWLILPPLLLIILRLRDNSFHRRTP